MRALYCDGSGVRLERDYPEPVVETADDVSIQVCLAGICDTDLQLARGYMGFAGVLGHELLGIDDQGRRVTAEINCPCGSCETCQAGRGNHCPHRTVLGILGRDGVMADHVVVPRRNLHAIPDAIDDLAAVLIEPLAAAYRLVEQAQPGPGDRLAVMGDGKLGLLCAWAARATGASIHLVGKHAEKLALAGEDITTHRLDEAKGLGRPFDIVVDATGSSSGFRPRWNWSGRWVQSSSRPRWPAITR